MQGISIGGKGIITYKNSQRTGGQCLGKSLAILRKQS
jgi:hypothetical protein